MDISFGIPTFAPMKKWIISFLFVVGAFGFGQAQTGLLFGTVRGEEKEPLEEVNVFTSDFKYQTTTDEHGYFELTLPANTSFDVVFSYLGATKKLTVNLKENQRKKVGVNLKIINDVPTAEVIGQADRVEPIQKLEIKGAEQIPTPNQGIEAVLVTTVANVNNELSSAFSVRGGSFDENLIYVNDIQVYRPFLVRSGQQEGLSFPNPDMVDNISFSAGGFEAKYGDKLSSVLDIHYKDPLDFEGSVTMSLLGGSVHIGDRSITNKGTDKEGYFSHNTGVRYKSYAYLLGALDTDGEYNPRFVDVQSYLTWKPRKNGLLEYSFLGNYSQNKYNFIPQSRQTDVGNINEAIRFSVDFEGQEKTQFETFFGAFAVKYFADETVLRFITSAFKTYEEEHFDIFGRYRLDELDRDLGSDQLGEVIRNRGIGAFRNHARNDLDATVINFSHIGSSSLNKNNHLEWGAKYQVEKINDKLSEWTLIDSAGYSFPHDSDSPGYSDGERPIQEINIQDLIKGKNNLNSSRVTGYVQNTTLLFPANRSKINFNYGMRAHYWSFNNQLVAGPRAHISYEPNWYRSSENGDSIKTDVIFTLAGGWYYQPAFYKEMRNLSGEINQDIKAQRSIHLVGGVNYLFTAWNRPFILKSEAYYKSLSNLIPYEVDNVRQQYYGTNNSKGYATGMDVMLNGEFIKGVQSWARASVLKSEEDILDDFYYEFINTDGETIIPGYTLNREVVDSNIVYPGFIPRPSDQRFSFSLLFRDEMRKWPEYKVLLSLYWSTGLPYGPPSNTRYLDTGRLPAYRRVDIGFSRDFFTNRPKENPSKTNGNYFLKKGWISLEVFNLLDIANTVNYTWIRDINGRFYGISNHLTSRKINLKLHFEF